jgi:hypothetical protein
MRILRWNIFPGDKGLELTLCFDNQKPSIYTAKTVTEATIAILSAMANKDLPIEVSEVNLVGEQFRAVATLDGQDYTGIGNDEISATINAIALASGIE